ncbi:MAG: hypothetical protein JWQ25_994 [Daejeonella sp.]|nr:hypothetical protein [Daejeonella sp.]
MKYFLPVLITFLNLTTAFAQNGREVSGIITDSTKLSIISATVKLTSPTDTILTSSNVKGEFLFKNVTASSFSITISSLGYRTQSKNYAYSQSSQKIQLDPIILKEQSNVLNEVVVSGSTPVTIKEDTVEYKTSNYKVRENAVAEDVLKKLPGVEVDKDGNVSAQGKAITKVRVNGKDYFGGDVRAATQNLPADIIDKMQIIEDYGDQANLTGIRTGDPERILNIQIRPDKNKGYIIKSVVGGGTRERYQASSSANYFNNSQQISFLGNLNNTNASLLNIAGSGGGGRGGRNSGGGGSSDGITSVSSIGLNFRQEINKKVTTYGSYSYLFKDNSIESNSIQQNIYNDVIINSTTSNPNSSINNNHRFNWNLEYKPDTINYIKISPTLTYNDYNSLGNPFSIVQRGNQVTNNSGPTISNSSTPNFGGNILLNHRFAKKGRNLSLFGNVNISNNEQDQDITNLIETGGVEVFNRQLQNITNNSRNTGGNISYTEPISKQSFLELSYNYNSTNYDNDRQIDSVNSSGVATHSFLLSNEYNYSFTTNKLGLNYRFQSQRYNYTLGAGVQPSLLKGNSVVGTTPTVYQKSGFNIIPVARFSYKFSRTRSFNFNYRGNSNEPSFTQLQPITDKSNTQFWYTGNPDLKAEFNQNLNVRYNNFDAKTGNTVFANLSTTITNNKIVNNTQQVDASGKIIQEIQYLNTNGYYTVNGSYNFSKPFSERKYVFSLNGSANYNNNVSFSDHIKNLGKNWVLSQGFNVQINPSEWLEVNPGVRYSYNTNTNDILTRGNTKVSTAGFSLNSKTYFLKTWLVGIDFSKTLNSGYSSLLANNPLILNTYLEKQFFKGKTGQLRLQAYDLFNQGTNISRAVNGTLITDSYTNRLTRYFMLTFSMKLQQFAGKKPDNLEGERREFGGRPNGGGPDGGNRNPNQF